MSFVVLHRSGDEALAVGGAVIQRRAYSVISSADRLLRDSREMAERTLAEAQDAAAQVHREAWEQGFAQGRLEGVESVLGTLETERRLRELLALRLAAIVEQCVRSMLGDIGSAEVFRARVIHLVRSTPPTPGMRLHVCAAQTPAARAALADLQSHFGVDINWLEVVGDERREPDSLMLETRVGFVDASVEMTLEAARDLIRRALLRPQAQGLE